MMLREHHCSIRRLCLPVGLVVVLSLRLLVREKSALEHLSALTDSFKQKPNTTTLSSWSETLEAVEDVLVDSSTGALFLGEPFRTFQGEQDFHSEWRNAYKTTENSTFDEQPSCSKWSVVTTIYAPTEAVRRAASLAGWCTAIVADTKTPKDFMEQAGLEDNQSVHFLSVQLQEVMAAQNSRVAAFVQQIPYRHFARKNIGFLYAIQLGAQFIFDFDDDNILNHDDDGVVQHPIPNETHLADARVAMVGPTVLNHHPLMGASLSSSWARGFPLERIRDTVTYGDVAYQNATMSMDRIGVLQFCANDNPDIDAIHRLVKPLPMTFNSKTASAKPLVVPSHAFAPYNAQATIHTANSLWATLLPISVPGRVSDIWRGYFAQALFRDLDLTLAFLPPAVVQDRNKHSYLADMKAELDLYFKVGKLLEFLENWQSSASTVPERMEALWIDLYERGYIEVEDVRLVQLWLAALVEIGYEFPAVKRQRYQNAVLMGQFNYAPTTQDTIFWVQKWKEVFQHVQVRGCFNDSHVAELTSHGIHAHAGPADRGILSPMRNLAETMQQYQNEKDIHGVVYLHDDAYLNMSVASLSFSSDHLLGSKVDFFPLSFQDARVVQDTEQSSKYSFRITSDAKFVKADGQVFINTGQLVGSLKRWNWKWCVKSLFELAMDPATDRYRDNDSNFIMPSPVQADFLYVPSHLTDEFVAAVELVVQHRVHLECGLSVIAQMLRHVANVTTIDTIPLCTEWSRTRGKAAMIQNCMAQTLAATSDKPSYYGMYHPFKISVTGRKTWGEMFDLVTFGV